MIIRGIFHTRDESDKNAKPVYHLPEEVKEGRLIATGEPVETVLSTKMSKSKNVVDLINMTVTSGANPAHSFVLSDRPPERDVEWTHSGGTGLIANATWPVADQAMMEDDSATLPIQINGKRRREITMAKDLDKAAIETNGLGELAVITALVGARSEK